MFVKHLSVMLTLAMMAGGVVACSGHVLIPQPQNPMYASSDADPSVCAYGGQAVNFGYDNNFNGVLDPDEIEHTVVVCNGAPGAAGANGTAGVNGANGQDGSTGTAGVQGTQGVAGQDGATGATGDTGATGATGDTGATGSSGTNGHNSLYSTAAAGTDVCPFGGLVLSFGLDLNDNGVLDAEEAGAPQAICNGAPGSNGTNGSNGTPAAPVLFAQAPALDYECPTGGTVVEAGQDTNLNGVLDNEEVQTHFAVCNGADGNSGNDGEDGQNGTISFTNVVSCNANLNGKTASFLGMTISTGETLATSAFDGSQLSVLSPDVDVVMDVVASNGTYHFNVDVSAVSGTVSKNGGTPVVMTCISYK